jgi:serine/threonine protein kinase
VKTLSTTHSYYLRRRKPVKVVATAMNNSAPTGYRLIRLLGEGGDGTVFLAKSTTNHLCAVKVFHADCFTQQQLALELSMKLRSWINLGSHPFIVEALSCGFYSNRAVLVMEYVVPDQNRNNISLQDYICNSERAVSFSLLIRWAIEVCLAMEHANRCGVTAHGDIKPSNILITHDRHAKLTDFGSTLTARTAETHYYSGKRANHLTSRWPLLANGGFIRGTSGYIPPEAYRGDKVDVRSDLFSFGVVLWQLAAASAAPPFIGRDIGCTSNSPDSVYRNQTLGRVPQTGTVLDPVIQRCLSPNPTGRFADFSHLRQEFERLLH